MSLAEHITFWLDPHTFGGVVSERWLAAIPKDETLWCGLCVSFPAVGAPTIEFWERADDLEKSGFVPVSPVKARAMWSGLHRFLEELERHAQREEVGV